ncbi:MAG: hypothetical protein FWH53_07830 [Leptospirales bacterium]|nr:hypothetical protein [Leptospirales bacterium]
MNYKSEIKKMNENRKKYFPLIEILLYVERNTKKENLPLEMTDVSQIALVMELMDIGYINKNSFIIKRDRRDIRGLFYNGGFPLTDAGIKVYRQNLHERKTKFKLGMLLVIIVLIVMSILYIVL